jgi:hypothetical protein
MNETERVEKNVDYLKILCKCESNMRKVILTDLDKDLINTICECVFNCLNGNIELNNEIKMKLKRHKKDFRDLVGRNKSLKIKIKILSQKGGAFLPLFLSTVLGGLSSIFLK